MVLKAHTSASLNTFTFLCSWLGVMWLAAWSSCLDFTAVVDCHLELWTVKLHFSPELLFSQSILSWPQKWKQGHGLHSHTFRGSLNFSYDWRVHYFFFLLLYNALLSESATGSVCASWKGLLDSAKFGQRWWRLLPAFVSECFHGHRSQYMCAHTKEHNCQVIWEELLVL